MSTVRGRSKRGGLGKYLRAQGRRGGGRPAEFGKRLVLEEEQEDEDEDDVEDEGDEDDVSSGGKYAKRELGTNAHRYEEPEIDPNVEQEPEPEVDLTSFLARQRLIPPDDDGSHHDDDDGIDHTLDNLPSASSRLSNTHKNKTQEIAWDASMDELKREKEAAEAIWDLKSRFRKNQPRLSATSSTPSRREQRIKIADARHVQQPPEPNTGNLDSKTTSTSKAEMEGFLDDLLS